MPPPYKKRQITETACLIGLECKVLYKNAIIEEAAAAAQKLQLCIYKGIHPRVPKKSGTDSRVFYHKKDIKFMAHEPSIAVLRKQRQFYRKIRAAQQRKDKAEALRLEKKFPKLSLSHVLKERYPTFQHALRDLDDPLTMAHLYANLHQQGHHREATELHGAAARLCAEFQAYIVKTHALRKVFVSVKGYYYQADVMGTQVTWCVPHKFVQNFDHKQIDPFIMTCYMEFYKTMLGFVNFRLFHSIGIQYPPKLTAEERNANVALEALLNKDDLQTDTIEGASDEELVELEDDEVGEKAAGQTAGVSVRDDAALCSKLFNGLVFFLGRETPVEQLIFVIQAFGGIVVCEDDAFDVLDARITHCVCDRGHIKEEIKAPGREYIQPQWIFDCCNARVLLPTELYAIGKIAPPHLSPFVSADEERYVPDYAKQIQKIQEAANLVRQTNDTAAQEQAMAEMLADDVELKEERELEKAKKEEEAYVGELELELETEFPTEISQETIQAEGQKAKKRLRDEQALKEKTQMDEIMVTKRHQYKKLKRKEYAKHAKIEKLKRKKAHLEQKQSPKL